LITQRKFAHPKIGEHKRKEAYVSTSQVALLIQKEMDKTENVSMSNWRITFNNPN